MINVIDAKVMKQLTIQKEWNIRLDTSDMIFSKSTSHSSDGSVPGLVMSSVFHQKTIEVGLDNHSWIGVPVDADSGADAVAAYIKHASVWGEVSRCWNNTDKIPIEIYKIQKPASKVYSHSFVPGSSVVMRHCIATPRGTIFSCFSPISSRDAPPAIKNVL